MIYSAFVEFGLHNAERRAAKNRDGGNTKVPSNPSDGNCGLRIILLV